MATVTEYLNKRGSFMAYSMPYFEYRTYLEIPGSRFARRFLPATVLHRLRNRRLALRRVVQDLAVMPEVLPSVLYLPKQCVGQLDSSLSKVLSSWQKFVSELIDRWDEFMEGSKEDLVDYLTTRWRRSSVHKSVTQAEYCASALNAMQVLAERGPQHSSFRFSCLRFEQSDHAEPRSTGYTGASALLWRWLNSVVDHAEETISAWFVWVSQKARIYEHIALDRWYDQFNRSGLLRKLDASRWYPALALCGKTAAIQVLKGIEAKVKEYHAKYFGNMTGPEGRDACVEMMRTFAEDQLKFVEAIQEHVDLQELVDNT